MKISEYAAGQRRSVKSSPWRDAAIAVLVAAFLSACWTLRDWTSLSNLLLPDPDDMMRLVQVRDWLAGQATNDWTQYRVAPPAGALMHWSRVNDVGIAGLILLGQMFGSRHAAEVAAVIIYPATLFAAHLYLTARIARRIWGGQAAVIAMLLGAFAYPGVLVFVPGRIDHHALQVVLIETAILAATIYPTIRSGAVVGIALAISLVIGLETLPQAVALTGMLAIAWIVGGDGGERARLLGVAGGLAVPTAMFCLFLRPTLWSRDLCDAFTPASSSAVFAGAAALAMLSAATPRLGGWRTRMAAGGALGLVVAGVIARAYPACLLGPYGRVHPFLQREFMSHIGEANGLFAQSDPLKWLALGGLMLVAVLAAFWTIRTRPAAWSRWGPVIATVLTSAALMLVQVRGSYIGAPVAAALLAGVVLAARRSGAVWLIAAWLACTGFVWDKVPALATPLVGVVAPARAEKASPPTPQQLCSSADGWRRIDRYPPGVVMTATGMSAYLLAQTHHATVAAGYHRNDAGNMAMYRYFLSSRPVADAIAREWHVDYVLFCPSDFSEMDAARRFPNSIAAALTRGETPEGFVPLPVPGSRLRLYRITA